MRIDQQALRGRGGGGGGGQQLQQQQPYSWSTSFQLQLEEQNKQLTDPIPLPTTSLMDHISSSQDNNLINVDYLQSTGQDNHRLPPPSSSSSSHEYLREQRISSNDGYNWRKYGQKQVKGSENPRSYYKCTYPDCPTKKKVERSLADGQITEIVYKGNHNHPKPAQNTRRSSAMAMAMGMGMSTAANFNAPPDPATATTAASPNEAKIIESVGTPDNSSISIVDDEICINDATTSHQIKKYNNIIRRKTGRDDFHDEEPPKTKRWYVQLIMILYIIYINALPNSELIN
ncbi:WRKY transcription factor [Dionaea muscipula]